MKPKVKMQTDEGELYIGVVPKIKNYQKGKVYLYQDVKESIDKRHRASIKQLGFSQTRDILSAVLKDPDRIIGKKERELFFQKRIDRSRSILVKVQKSGSGYKVVELLPIVHDRKISGMNLHVAWEKEEPATEKVSSPDFSMALGKPISFLVKQIETLDKGISPTSVSKSVHEKLTKAQEKYDSINEDPKFRNIAFIGGGNLSKASKKYKESKMSQRLEAGKKVDSLKFLNDIINEVPKTAGEVEDAAKIILPVYRSKEVENLWQSTDIKEIATYAREVMKYADGKIGKKANFYFKHEGPSGVNLFQIDKNGEIKSIPRNDLMYKRHAKESYIEPKGNIATEAVKKPEPTKEMIDFFKKRTAKHIKKAANNLGTIIKAFPDLDTKNLEKRKNTHDASKYEEDEYLPYIWNTEFHRVNNKGGKFEYPPGMEEKTEKAWKHHAKVNKHHPEAHKTTADMTKEDLAEMVADWAAMSQELGTGLKKWADDTISKKWKFSKDQLKFIYSLIDIFEKPALEYVIKPEDTATLWYENGKGKKWYPDYSGKGPIDPPKGYIYQVSKFPNEVRENMLRSVVPAEVEKCKHPEEHIRKTYGWIDGMEGRECAKCNGTQVKKVKDPWPEKWDAEGSRNFLTMSTTWTEAEVMALVNDAGYPLHEAIQLATSMCGRCISALLFDHGSKEAEFAEFSLDWFNENVSCKHCEDHRMDPITEDKLHRYRSNAPVYLEILENKIKKEGPAREHWESHRNLITKRLAEYEKKLGKLWGTDLKPTIATESIIDQILSGEIDIALEKQITYPKRYGQIVFLAGGGASGKGFVINKFINSSNFKIIDVDKWKSQYLQMAKVTDKFPELRNMDLRNPKHVFALHKFIKERKLKDRIVDLLLGDAKRDRLPNIIFDVTMKDESDMKKVLPKLLKLGYDPKDIHLVWVLTNYHDAVAQNKTRKRVVPDDIMLDAHENAAMTMDKILQGKGYLKNKSMFDGSIKVVLNNKEETKFYPDGKTVKSFTYLTAKDRGRSVGMTPQEKKKLEQWIIGNIPRTKKTKELWKNGEEDKSLATEKVKEINFNDSLGKPFSFLEKQIKEYDIQQSGDPKSLTNYKRFDTFFQKVYKREVSVEEVQRVFKELLSKEDIVKNELSTLTVKDLKKEVRGYMRETKKQDLIDQVYEGLLTSFGQLGEGMFSYSYTGPDSMMNAIKSKVEGLTPEDLEYEAADYDKRTAEKKALIESLKDPQTLEDFEKFIQYFGKGKFTPEQQERYDELKAEKNLELQKEKEEKASTIAAVEIGDTQLTMEPYVHTKTGAEMTLIKMSDRVSKDTYKELNSKAKQFGGFYSKWAKGFLFKDEESAKQFSSIGEEEQDVSEQQAERKEEKEVKQVSKLREMADKMEEKAIEERDRDRQMNTPKRAREGAGAIANAEANIAFANTMKNLATAIETGQSKFLNKVKTKADIVELEHMVNSAKYRHDNKNIGSEMAYSEREAIRDAPPSKEQMKEAEYPYPLIWRDDLLKIAEKTKSVPGLKKISNSFLKIVDKLIAEDNKNKNRDNERFPVRNQRYIDDLKMLVKAVEMKTKDNPSTPFESVKYEAERIKEMIKDYDRVKKMGIPDVETLRATLREFLQFKETPEAEDPIKAKERELIGTKIPGFFPTPDKVIEEDLLPEVDIQPGDKVLEPSGGSGKIADKIREQQPDADLTTIEQSGTLRELLDLKGHKVSEDTDFLEHTEKYDKIVMNPPFENLQDIDHVKHAYSLLEPGGKMVSVMGEGPFFRSDKKSVAFREWLEEVDAVVEKLPEKSFKSKEAIRQTGVNTRKVVIEKPETAVEGVAVEAVQIDFNSALGKPIGVLTTQIEYFETKLQDEIKEREFQKDLEKHREEKAKEIVPIPITGKLNPGLKEYFTKNGIPKVGTQFENKGRIITFKDDEVSKDGNLLTLTMGYESGGKEKEFPLVMPNVVGQEVDKKPVETEDDPLKKEEFAQYLIDKIKAGESKDKVIANLQKNISQSKHTIATVPKDKAEPGFFKTREEGIERNQYAIDKINSAFAVDTKSEAKEPWEMTKEDYAKIRPDKVVIRKEKEFEDFLLSNGFKKEIEGEFTNYVKGDYVVGLIPYPDETRASLHKRTGEVTEDGRKLQEEILYNTRSGEKILEIVDGKTKGFLPHKRYIEQALSKGEKVPAEVLMDYPELVKTGVADYEERKEARIERMEEKALKATQESEARYKSSAQIGERFAMGQPILVGHHSEGKARRDQERMWAQTEKSIEAGKKAEHYAQKAASAESSTAISSDDPEAVVKLKEKVQKLEADQELMKKINATWRKFNKKPESLDKSDLDEKYKAQIRKYKPEYSWDKGPFPSYAITNNGANLRKTKERLKELIEQSFDETTTLYDENDIQVIDNVEENRVQIFFPGKPSAEIREKLSSNGFNFSRTNDAWQRKRSSWASQLALDIVKESEVDIEVS